MREREIPCRRILREGVRPTVSAACDSGGFRCGGGQAPSLGTPGPPVRFHLSHSGVRSCAFASWSPEIKANVVCSADVNRRLNSSFVDGPVHVRNWNYCFLSKTD